MADAWSSSGGYKQAKVVALTVIVCHCSLTVKLVVGRDSKGYIIKDLSLVTIETCFVLKNKIMVGGMGKGKKDCYN